jgi:Carboxypeptidase regulatory-like domain
MKGKASFLEFLSSRRRNIFFNATWILALASVTPFAHAQSTGGRIRGTVTDPSGGAVVGATVTLLNEATHATRDVQTGANGEYIFLEVPVGSYEIDVSSQGFKQYARKGIPLNLNEVVSVDVVLQVGGSTEKVEVTGAPPVVDTSSTQLGAVMNSVAVSELPLNLRNTYALLQLQPGVSSQFGSSDTVFFGADNPGVVSVNGGRGRANNYMVNGGDGNDLFVNLPAIQPSPDAIDEFRVLTNTFDAEYGRNSGSVVNVVTKSGTNQVHGSFYEYFRNTVLDANTFFNNAAGVAVPDFKQNQFGGTLGGPVRKDRTFLFGSYEGRRIRQGIPSGTVFLPTASEISGDFSGGGAASPFSGTLTNPLVANILENRSGCNSALTPAGQTALSAAAAGTPQVYSSIFANNQIPTQCFDPVAVNLFQQFVQPVDTNPTGLAATAPDKKDRGDQATVRFDHKISANQEFSAYYYFDDDSRLEPFAFFQAAGANVPGFGSLFATRIQQWNMSHTWTVGATSVNEFRFNYFRESQETNNHPGRIHPVTSSCTGAAASFCFNGTPDTPTAYTNAGITLSPSLGITPNLSGREGVPFISVSGGFIIGNNSEGELPQTGNTFQWADNYTKVVRSHTVKFGGDVRRQHFDQFLYFDVNGSFGFSPGGPNDLGFSDLYPNYFLGLPNSFGQGSAQLENVRSSAVYLFAQDSWKLKANLTLNYGLRWELDTPQYDTGNRLQTFRPGQADTLYPCVIGSNGSALTGYPVGTDCSPTGPGASVFPLGEVIPGDKGIQRGMTSTYYKAFAPRIGLAWSPAAKQGFLAKVFGGPGKSSIRMGYGIFYNPIEQLVLEQFSAEPPFGGSTFVSSPLLQTPYVLQSGSTIPNPFNGVLSPKVGTPVDWSVFRPILLFGEFQPHLRTQYADQYNLTFQRQLTERMRLQIGYVGTQAHRLLASHDLNFGNAATCLALQQISAFYAPSNGNPNPNADTPLSSALACAPFSEDTQFVIPTTTTLDNGQTVATIIPPGVTLPLPYGPVPSVSGGANGTTVASIAPNGINLVGLRRFSSPLCQPLLGTAANSGCPPDGTPVFSNIFAENTIGNSSYNALQISLEQAFSHGLQFTAAYTFSKSLDNASSFEELLNPINPRLSRSLSLFNATHRFVFSPYWVLPIPKYDGFRGKLFDGWGASAIVTYQSGFPVRILDGNDQELMGSFFFLPVGEPDRTGPFQTFNGRKVQSFNGVSANYFFNPNSFADPNLGQFGNASRTICCGPAISNTDMSILKRTRINERWDTEFRAEFFNAWNHTQFLNPDGNFSDLGSTFGVVTNTRDPRVIQFALKFLF